MTKSQIKPEKIRFFAFSFRLAFQLSFVYYIICHNSSTLRKTHRLKIIPKLLTLKRPLENPTANIVPSALNLNTLTSFSKSISIFLAPPIERSSPRFSLPVTMCEKSVEISQNSRFPIQSISSVPSLNFSAAVW